MHAEFCSRTHFVYEVSRRKQTKFVVFGILEVGVEAWYHYFWNNRPRKRNVAETVPKNIITHFLWSWRKGIFKKISEKTAKGKSTYKTHLLRWKRNTLKLKKVWNTEGKIWRVLQNRKLNCFHGKVHEPTYHTSAPNSKMMARSVRSLLCTCLRCKRIKIWYNCIPHYVSFWNEYEGKSLQSAYDYLHIEHKIEQLWC